MKSLVFPLIIFFLYYPLDNYSQDKKNKHSSHLKSSSQEKIKTKELFNNYPQQFIHGKRTKKSDPLTIIYKNNNEQRKRLDILNKENFSEDYLTGWTRQNWTDNDWGNDSKYIPTYDGTNYNIEEVWQIWNGSAWINSERETETHDGNGNWLEWFHYIWNGTAWEENDRETQSYDANGNWVEWIDYDLSGNVWVNSDRKTQSYDANGNWVEWFEYYPWTGTAWENYNREIQSYDANGNWVEWIDYNWPGTTWENNEKETQSYDANGNWVEWIDYNWTGTVWENYEKETQSYDANGNWIEWIDYYPWTGAAWENYKRETQSYDANDNGIEWISQEWNASEWINVTRFVYTYSSTTDISEISEPIISYGLSNNYPNPFNPSTTIEFKIAILGFVSLKAYDILGNEIATLVNEIKQSGKYKVTLDARNLSSGVYFYKLQTNSFVQTKKMLLMK